MLNPEKVIVKFLACSVFLFQSCSRQDRAMPIIVGNDITLVAFIISDNDLDDLTDYIENDFVRGFHHKNTVYESFLFAIPPNDVCFNQYILRTE